MHASVYTVSVCRDVRTYGIMDVFIVRVKGLLKKVTGHGGSFLFYVPGINVLWSVSCESSPDIGLYATRQLVIQEYPWRVVYSLTEGCLPAWFCQGHQDDFVGVISDCSYLGFPGVSKRNFKRAFFKKWHKKVYRLLFRRFTWCGRDT